MKYVIVTGMSGAGKSTALKYMEDIGYFCVDNLPIPLLEKFIELAEAGDKHYSQIALGMDARNGDAIRDLAKIKQQLQTDGVDIQMIFMDASTPVLLKRYKETRRNHPMAGQDRLEIGIEKERELVGPIMKASDYIIDTSDLLAKDVNAMLGDIFLTEQKYDNLFLSILSFGFKYGIPTDADLVFDVRFLPNPYYVEGLRPKTGNDNEIQEYVMQTGEGEIFLDKLEDMLRFLIPQYIREGKHRLVLAIGCTGGKHRSVTIANAIYQRMKTDQSYGLRVEHRDLEKDAKRGK